MNINDIVIAHLKSIGADGLCSESCGCSMDDLFPCSEWSGCSCAKNCVPAKRVIATDAGEYHEIGDEIFQEIKP